MPRTEKTFWNYFSRKKTKVTLCPIWSRAPAVAGILGSFSPTSCGASDRGALTLTACRPSLVLRLHTCRRDPRGLLCGFSRLCPEYPRRTTPGSSCRAGTRSRSPAGPCTGGAMPRGLRLPCASCGVVIHSKKGIQFIRYQHDIPGPQGTRPGKSPYPLEDLPRPPIPPRFAVGRDRGEVTRGRSSDRGPVSPCGGICREVLPMLPARSGPSVSAA